MTENPTTISFPKGSMSNLDQIIEKIELWMNDLSHNALEPGAKLPAFSKPLVGIASGDDELFRFLKKDIGPNFFWQPEDAFAAAFPGERIKPDELSVIAWVLPQTERTRQAQSKAIDRPSIEWSKARHYGEKVNEELRRYLVDQFLLSGYRACAPVLLPQWQRAQSPKYGFASSWSERHAAYVCGLGTFGVSDGLITPVGKAIRVGSVIVQKRYTPTRRTYQHHNEWCLYHSTGKCLVCKRRCPAQAISKIGHDKIRCKEFIRNVTAVYVEKEQLGFRVNSCGFCQTKTPCENQNPTDRMKRKRSD